MATGILMVSCTEIKLETPIAENTSLRQAKIAALDEKNEFKKTVKAHFKLMKELDNEKKAKKFKSLDNQKLLNELRQCKTKEETIKIFSKFGLKKGKDVAESFETVRKSMISEISKHPEMKDWNEEEKKAYLKEIFTN
jgi:hypothetical protein